MWKVEEIEVFGRRLARLPFNFSVTTASAYLELGAYNSQPFECSETPKSASYDERWLSLKRNLLLFLAGWLAGTTEPSISNFCT